MSNNTASRDIRTLGYVTRRTNYGEADRILNIITPVGKIAAMAKGVRKEKSRLAGGVEMFTLTDFNIHRGKSDLAVVTGAKMIKHHGNIVKDFERLELAGMVLKKTSMAAESSDSSDYFMITRQSLTGLDCGFNCELVEGWFLLNLLRAMGEEVNLYRDINGEKLDGKERYEWGLGENCFCRKANGEYGVDEIKMLRLMSSVELGVASRVKGVEEMSRRVLPLIRVFAKM